MKLTLNVKATLNRPNQTEYTKPNLPNQAYHKKNYQTKPTKLTKYRVIQLNWDNVGPYYSGQEAPYEVR